MDSFMNDWWCPVCMCLIASVLPLHLFFWLLFSKVFPHWFPLVFGCYAMFPVFQAPTFSPFSPIGFQCGTGFFWFLELLCFLFFKVVPQSMFFNSPVFQSIPFPPLFLSFHMGATTGLHATLEWRTGQKTRTRTARFRNVNAKWRWLGMFS